MNDVNFLRNHDQKHNLCDTSCNSSYLWLATHKNLQFTRFKQSSRIWTLTVDFKLRTSYEKILINKSNLKKLKRYISANKLHYWSFLFSEQSRLFNNFEFSSSYINQQSETKTPTDNSNIITTWILKLVKKSIPNKTRIKRIKTKQVNKRTDLLIPGLKIESTIPWSIVMNCFYFSKMIIK